MATPLDLPFDALVETQINALFRTTSSILSAYAPGTSLSEPFLFRKQIWPLNLTRTSSPTRSTNNKALDLAIFPSCQDLSRIARNHYRFS